MSTAQEYPRDGGRPSAGAKEQNSGETVASKQFTAKLSARQVSFRTLSASLVLHGFRVFPLAAGKKTPAISKEKGGNGFYDATTDPAQLDAWSKKYPHANVGIRAGDGLVVIDEDAYKGASLASWQLPPTLCARSARGGFHRFYHYADILPCVNEGILAPGVCIKADGGYVVGAGSVFEGGRYEWIDENQPIAELPEEIAERIRDATTRPEVPASGRVQHSSSAEYTPDGDGTYWLDKALARTGDGQGDPTGYWLACQLLIAERHGAPVDVKRVLQAYAVTATVNPRDPFTERDVERWIKSAEKSDIVAGGERARSQSPSRTQFRVISSNGRAAKDAGAHAGSESTSETTGSLDEPRKWYRHTEMGNADRLFDAYGQNMRYCKELGFCTWNGKHWEADSELRIRGWAEKVIRSLYDEAAQLSRQAAQADEDTTTKELGARAEKLLEWARKSSTHSMVSAMVGLIKPRVLVSHELFDAKPMLFNCANGTLDLTTGQLRPHRREDYLMQCSTTEHRRDENATTFKRFLHEIMLADDPSRPDYAQRVELVHYLQRVFGYALTGDTSEQEWYLLVGKDGDNGKTTLIEDAICSVLSGYSYTLEPEAITVTGRPKDSAAPSPERAGLKGKRLVRVTETEKGARLAAALIKKLCGQDEIAGRHLHKEIIHFRPTHKLFIYTNHKPHVRETGHAFWRRVRYIPFDFTLKNCPERKDKQLGKKLRAEASGILNWMIEGCLAWQREGLNPPKIVLQATEEYQAESNLLRPFFEERCVIHSEAKVSAADLYNAYKAWCADTGEHPMRQRDFGSALSEQGFTKGRGFGKTGAHGWYGIGLRSNDTPPPPSDPSDPTYPHFRDFANPHSHKGKMPQVGSGGSEGSVTDPDLWTAEGVTPANLSPATSGVPPRLTFEERVESYKRQGMREDEAIRRCLEENAARAAASSDKEAS